MQDLLDEVDRDGSGSCEYIEYVEIMTVRDHFNLNLHLHNLCLLGLQILCTTEHYSSCPQQ